MAELSILFADGNSEGRARLAREPECFCDLNLDLPVEGILAGLNEYRLRELFYLLLSDPAEIRYRQEAARELEAGPVLAVVKEFALGMRAARERKAQAARVGHMVQRDRWFLDAVDAYCRAVLGLSSSLVAAARRSPSRKTKNSK